MLLLHQFTGEPSACEYLPGRVAQMDYGVAASLSPAEYDERMSLGYRKFGMLLFRPVCSRCSECRPIRVDSAAFAPNRSQKRAALRNRDLQIVIARPSVDSARLELFQEYHRWQSGRKGWHDRTQSMEEYAFSFLKNPLPSVEISLWGESGLCGIVLMDVSETGLSAVYHYYDPSLAGRSLGTFALLQALELARSMNKAWLYLGYYVRDSASMRYKASFRPAEVLEPDGLWHPLSTSSR